ncbi:hypothetical protein G6F61_014407 [Rhizopus arrhizus]|uniref:Uncharacterized protein n=1 Tax=Rhizopus oryzae TaxID=64495 RepID=A0A9P6WSN4_RHIOR|nr:hypothetical protein G6F64_015143 [Rhizopus arrhizus]KAG1360435.1 hypothetical protein G6F61_014407 [Rhizopus arrhizus]
MHDRHRAHRTRLQGHVQGAAKQPVIGQQPAPRPHGHDLGVRAGIVRGDVEIPAFAQQLAIGADQHRPDRNLVELALRAFGQRQCMAHPVLIGVVHRYTQGVGHGGSRVVAGPGWPPGR